MRQFLIQELLWPNGQGIALRRRGLQVRVLPGVLFIVHQILDLDTILLSSIIFERLDEFDYNLEAMLADAHLFLGETLIASSSGDPPRVEECTWGTTAKYYRLCRNSA